MKIIDSALIKISNHVTYHVDDKDFVVLLDTKKEQILFLNETGSFIWKNLIKQKLYAEILKVISENYESVSKKETNNLLKNFIIKLQKRGFLTIK